MVLGSPRLSWGAATVEHAIRIGSLRGFAACPVALGCVVLTTDTPLPLPALLACHAAYAGGVCCVIWREWDARIALVGLYLLLLLDFLAATGPTAPLAVASAWVALLATGAPGLLMRGRQAFLLPSVASATMAAVVALLRPDWGLGLPTAVVLGTWVIWPAALVFRRAIDALVARTDDQEEAAERELRRLVVARTAARGLAEDARVLHDSVINTMAAIASSGSWAADAALVRRRCQRDVQTVERMLAGRRGEPSEALPASDIGIPVRRTGVSDDDFEQLAALLSAGARRALTAAVEEVLRNVAKHAEATGAVLDLRRRGHEVVVTVSDDGIGFDGVVIAGRGLAESVVRRVEEVGGWAEIRSRAGHGTTVVLGCPLETDPRPSADIESDDGDVDALRRTACWSWAVAVLGAGLLIEVANRPDRFTSSWAALAVVAVPCLLTFVLTRRGGELHPLATALVVAVLPIGFLLGFAGVGSGHDEPYLWFPIGLTPLLVVLRVLRHSWAPLAGGILAMTLPAVVVSVRRWDDDRAAAVIALTLVLVQLCQMAAWLEFDRTVSRLGRRLVSDQRHAAARRRESDARAALATARERWSAAGVRASLEVLRPIAAGRVAPSDPLVRARCDEEERHLRQLTMISPELVHLNGWLALALAEARARSVRLILRAGDVDVRDPELADQLGRVAMEVVAATPPGETVTLSLFAVDTVPRLHVVGDRGVVDVDRLGVALPDDWRLEHHNLGAQDFVAVRTAGDLEHAAALSLEP